MWHMMRHAAHVIALFFNFKFYPFLFGNSFFNTDTGKRNTVRKKAVIFWLLLFFFSFVFFLLFFLFSWSNLNWSISRSTCMRHKVNNHRLFILSCFIPNSFSFFRFLWFSLCFNRCSFSLFSSYDLSFSLSLSLSFCVTHWCLPCFRFVLRPYWLPAWEKAIQTHMCRHRTQYYTYRP